MNTKVLHNGWHSWRVSFVIIVWPGGGGDTDPLLGVACLIGIP